MSTPQPDRERRFRTLYDDTYVDVLRFAQRRVHPSHAEDVDGIVIHDAQPTRPR